MVDKGKEFGNRIQFLRDIALLYLRVCLSVRVDLCSLGFILRSLSLLRIRLINQVCSFFTPEVSQVGHSIWDVS